MRHLELPAARGPRSARGWRLFTLVELVAVIVVVGLLATLATVTYSRVVARSEVEKAQARSVAVAREVAALMAFHANENLSGAALDAAYADAFSKAVADLSEAAAGGVFAAGGAFALDACRDGWTLTESGRCIIEDDGPEDDPLSVVESTHPDEYVFRTAAGKLGFASLVEGTTGVFCRVDSPQDAWCWTADYGPRTVTARTALAGQQSAPVAAPELQPPDAPTAVVATAGDGWADVSFEAGADNGWPIDEFTVVSNPDGVTATGTASPIRVEGLTNGVTYTFTVTATSVAGSATSAPSNPVTPITIPGAPAGIIVVPGDGTVTIDFAEVAGTPEAPVDGYRVYAGDQLVWQGTGSPAVIGGLTNGTLYTFQVVTYGPAGEGPRSSAMSATPAGPPAAPATPTATRGNGSVTLTWTAPASNGAPITGYAVRYRAGTTGTFTELAPATGLSRTVTGLTNGTAYQFSVRAINSAGPGAWSPTVSATPATVPGAPSLSLSASHSRGFTATWTAPGNGGSPIIEYWLEYRISGGAWQRIYTTATSGAVTPGVFKRQIDVRVAARNAVGQGSYSAIQTIRPWSDRLLQEANPTVYERLVVGEAIQTSPTATYHLIVQGDGNAVMYGPSGALWATGTGGMGLINPHLTFYYNGQLVLSADNCDFGKICWSPAGVIALGGHLRIQSDGNLVVYNASGAAVWSRFSG